MSPEDRATIRWRYRYGAGEADYVRGVNLMRIVNGVIVEALGYSKTPPSRPCCSPQPAPRPSDSHEAQTGIDRRVGR